MTGPAAEGGISRRTTPTWSAPAVRRARFAAAPARWARTHAESTHVVHRHLDDLAVASLEADARGAAGSSWPIIVHCPRRADLDLDGQVLAVDDRTEAEHARSQDGAVAGPHGEGEVLIEQESKDRSASSVVDDRQQKNLPGLVDQLPAAPGRAVQEATELDEQGVTPSGGGHVRPFRSERCTAVGQMTWSTTWSADHVARRRCDTAVCRPTAWS
jgi:hypothetical protein